MGRKSKKLIVVFILAIFLLPIIYIGDHLILHYQLKGAVEKFSEEHCGQVLKETEIDIRLFPNFNGRRRWVANTTPEIIGINGEYIKGTAWLSRPRIDCNFPIDGKEYILDRFQREFTETDKHKPMPTSPI